jgi:uncharacterized membrane protein YiaA
MENTASYLIKCKTGEIAMKTHISIKTSLVVLISLLIFITAYSAAIASEEPALSKIVFYVS